MSYFNWLLRSVLKWCLYCEQFWVCSLLIFCNRYKLQKVTIKGNRVLGGVRRAHRFARSAASLAEHPLTSNDTLEIAPAWKPVHYSAIPPWTIPKIISGHNQLDFGCGILAEKTWQDKNTKGQCYGFREVAFATWSEH